MVWSMWLLTITSQLGCAMAYALHVQHKVDKIVKDLIYGSMSLKSIEPLSVPSTYQQGVQSMKATPSANLAFLWQISIFTFSQIKAAIKLQSMLDKSSICSRLTYVHVTGLESGTYQNIVVVCILHVLA